MVKLCAMEMLEVIACKHEGMHSFQPRELDAVSSTSFVQMEDQVIASEMKARVVALKSPICVLATDLWLQKMDLQLVVDRGCRQLVANHAAAKERPVVDHGCSWLQIVEIGLLQIVARWNLTW